MPQQGGGVAHRGGRGPAAATARASGTRRGAAMTSTGNAAYALERGVVIVRGPDATSFLRSLLSQDLDPVPVGAAVPSLLLQPQGKLVATMDAVHAADDEWWLCTDVTSATDLAAGLNRFKIRV